jgi:subtilase family serine protease
VSSTAGGTAETNESNNAAASAAPVGIAMPFVDLIGVALAARGNFTAGKLGAAGLTIRNDGNVPAKATFAVQLFATPDGVLDGVDDLPLFDGPVRMSLKPGAARTFSLRADLASVSMGNYTLVAVIDTSNAVVESDESNDMTVAQQPVVVSV